LADDQADIRDALRLLLKREGYETQGVASPAEALRAIESREFDAVLMDLNYARDTTSGQEGLDLLTRIQMLDSTLPVIVMTAWSSIEVAVEAMRRGARDFVQKPWENTRLLAILRTQIDLRQALRQASRLEAENRILRAESRPTFLAKSAAMVPVLELIGEQIFLAHDVEPVKGVADQADALFVRHVLVRERHFQIFEDRQIVDQVIALKHKPNVRFVQFVALFDVQLVNRFAQKVKVSGPCAIQHPDDAE